MSLRNIQELTVSDIKNEAAKLGLNLLHSRELKPALLEKLRVYCNSLSLTQSIEDKQFDVDVPYDPTTHGLVENGPPQSGLGDTGLSQGGSGSFQNEVKTLTNGKGKSNSKKAKNKVKITPHVIEKEVAQSFLSEDSSVVSSDDSESSHESRKKHSKKNKKKSKVGKKHKKDKKIQSSSSSSSSSSDQDIGGAQNLNNGFIPGSFRGDMKNLMSGPPPSFVHPPVGTPMAGPHGHPQGSAQPQPHWNGPMYHGQMYQGYPFMNHHYTQGAGQQFGYNQQNHPPYWQPTPVTEKKKKSKKHDRLE